MLKALKHVLRDVRDVTGAVASLCFSLLALLIINSKKKKKKGLGVYDKLLITALHRESRAPTTTPCRSNNAQIP